ncbi:hypothetical protein [Streptomyces sp. NPDC005374]|uniref:hypothetical protein n=1 Tax=Streptomyces sp. NPDC005374 TaxID=3364713 RepID=UPI0036B0A642
MAISTDSNASDKQCRERGVWPADVKLVSVHCQLAGGRGGARVLEISVACKDRPASLQVAKLMPYEDAVQEWEAYQRLQAALDSSVYVPIVAVSRAVHEQRDPELTDSVVVYRHVSDWNHVPGSLESLESAIAAAVASPQQLQRCRQTVDRVLASLSRTFYGSARSEDSDLEGENQRLAIDLHLKVDKVTGSGAQVCLVHGNPGAQAVFPRPSSSEVLRTASSPPGPDRSLRTGDTAEMTLERVAVKGNVVYGDYHSTRVCVELTGEAEEHQQRTKVRNGRTIRVKGLVTAVRADQWSNYLQEHFHGTDTFGEDVDTQTLCCEGTTVAHPLVALHSLLVNGAGKRMRSAVHGDLNPRNVILSDNTPYLIDFATFAEDAFTAADITWLEMCILRDCIAAHLTWPEIVRLQRALGLLAMLLPHWDAQELQGAVSALGREVGKDSSVLERCLLILWQVRCGIWDVVPEDCRGEWPQHYSEHLILSACHTFKWPDREAPERVRVSAAAAGVASEFLAPSDVFGHWPDQDKDAAARVLLASGNTDAVTLRLLENVTAGCGNTALRREILKRLSARPLREARHSLHQQYTASPPAGELDWGDDFYIEMEGRQLAPGEPYVQLGQGALTLQSQDCLQLLAQHPAVVLLAEPGGGKSRIARELRLGQLREEDAAETQSGMLPLQATALQIMEFLGRERGPERTVARFLLQLAEVGPLLSEDRLGHLIDLGAVHLTIDDLHVVSDRDQRKILAWIKRLRARQPELRLLVCQRMGDFHPDVLRWPVVVVHKVRESAARGYATRVLLDRRLDNWPRLLERLEHHLFADPAAAALRDLAGKPQLLRLLVHHLVETREMPASLGGLVRTYLTKMLDQVPSDGSLADKRLPLLGSLAEDLDSAGSLTRERTLQVLERSAQDTSADGDTLLDVLLATGVIIASGDRISFRYPLVQSYCAAIALQNYPKEQLPRVRQLILRHGWRETAVLLVADEYSPASTVLEAVQAGVDASPWYGALLLQAAPEQCTQGARTAFLHAQLEVLRSPHSGIPAWKRSAYALAKYGVPAATDILVTIASAARSAPQAAQAALDGLVMMHQWSVPGATQQLTKVVAGILENEERDAEPGSGTVRDIGVMVRALRSVHVAGLHELAGYVWSRITPGQPWGVVWQAWQTLKGLQTRSDLVRSLTYAQACRSRLSALDSELRTTADTETAVDLNGQRLDVLRDLAALGDAETLLTYRFRAGLAEDPAWGQMLQDALAAGPSALPTLLEESTLRVVGVGCEQWKRLLTAGNENLAALAAHYILTARDVVSIELLSEVAALGTARSLAVVAAFVHCLSPDEHKLLEQLLVPFLVSMDEAMVEAVASFVSAAETLDQDTGRRLALRVQQALAAQGLDQEALHWPWCTTWRRALPPRAEIPLFLAEHSRSAARPEAGPDATLLAMLGSADVLLDAPYVKPVSLTPEMRTRLGSLKPATSDGLPAHQFVLLAASAGLPDELRFVRQVARDEYNVQTVIRHSHGQHGLVEVTLAAHAVTATGYLGMLAALEDPDLDVATITHPLEELGRQTSDMHPSMERARLIALGYFGQLAPLLGALCAREDVILAHAVRNIVNHWLPGPRTSMGTDPYFTKVAETLTEKLRSKQLPPQTRALLTELRIGIEDRLGRYVI